MEPVPPYLPPRPSRVHLRSSLCATEQYPMPSNFTLYVHGLSEVIVEMSRIYHGIFGWEKLVRREERYRCYSVTTVYSPESPLCQLPMVLTDLLAANGFQLSPNFVISFLRFSRGDYAKNICLFYPRFQSCVAVLCLTDFHGRWSVNGARVRRVSRGDLLVLLGNHYLSFSHPSGHHRHYVCVIVGMRLSGSRFPVGFPILQGCRSEVLHLTLYLEDIHRKILEAYQACHRLSEISENSEHAFPRLALILMIDKLSIVSVSTECIKNHMTGYSSSGSEPYVLDVEIEYLYGMRAMVENISCFTRNVWLEFSARSGPHEQMSRAVSNLRRLLEDIGVLSLRMIPYVTNSVSGMTLFEGTESEPNPEPDPNPNPEPDPDPDPNPNPDSTSNSESTSSSD
ncbi:hypothetical protein [Eastern grey kangaroopox virus]|uniref:Uncharacterized protein n=1 Tax=Eastern grey kangaroopox virus TaxID=2042482 RepID=A0A2C9DSX4_9POXV|nr:hypothetical protein KM541_gp011 [Eastern grey kangaroopox virus]ATI21107.1 hypothetical protein [Eastern grey kangaroopox virus]ATX75013.1 hypothetical protein EKPV-NSW-ORF020 [Eastern grey kangaroopox virus]